MGTSDIAKELKNLILNNNPPLADRVWFGMPNKIPKNAKTIIVIEPFMNPNYYYTTCPQQTTKDIDFYITITTKGKDEVAHLNNWDVTDEVETLLLNTKIDNCIESTIEDITRGFIGIEEQSLVASSRITLRCKT